MNQSEQSHVQPPHNQGQPSPPWQPPTSATPPPWLGAVPTHMPPQVPAGPPPRVDAPAPVDIPIPASTRNVPHQDAPAQNMPTEDVPAPQVQHLYVPPSPQQFIPPPQQVLTPVRAPAIDDVKLLRQAKRPPRRGWRRFVHRISGGLINVGESADELRLQALIERASAPIRGDYRIAVLSLKGGVGKTTTTIGLGSTFASLRGDRVIAVDANPDLGTLSQRMPTQTASTVRDLLSDPSISRYSDVRSHTSQAASRLEVLASERDPAYSEAFSESDYRGVSSILQRYYNLILTDCGTGLTHSAMSGVLDLANALILVSSPAIDGAKSASATLDWLSLHGYDHLVANTVVVISSARPGATTLDIDQLMAHFASRCRAVHVIPFDNHLAEGAQVDLELLNKATRRAFIELAATVAERFTTHP